MSSKMKTTSKMKKKYLNFFMTFYLDIHTTTDVKPEMIPGVQAGNGIPQDKYNLCVIVHARTTEKTKKIC